MIVATVARHRGATRPATSAFELGSSPPETDSGEEAEDAEEDGAVDGSAEGVEAGEEDRADDDGALLAEAVAEAAAGKSADHHSDECQGAQRPDRRVRQSPPGGFDERGLDGAEDDEVVAVGDHEQPGHEDGHRGHDFRRGGGCGCVGSAVTGRVAHVRLFSIPHR